MNKKNRRNHNQAFVANHDPNFKIKKKAAGQIALKALSSLGYSHIQVNLVFTTDSHIKRINRRFLNHNWPTDVLAFPYAPSLRAPKGRSHLTRSVIPECFNRGSTCLDSRFRGNDSCLLPRNDGIRFLGEVFISLKRALVQAPLYKSSFKEELARYICHGILHLAGFKDRTGKERGAMRQKEDKILNRSRHYIQRII